jgi:hypothetical protein
MEIVTVNVGRVIRVGRGWADVTIDRKVHRVNTRPDLLVKVGSHLRIINELGVSILPASDAFTGHRLQ